MLRLFNFIRRILLRLLNMNFITRNINFILRIIIFQTGKSMLRTFNFILRIIKFIKKKLY